MNCPHCASMATKEQTKRTRLCYRTFRCSGCKRTFNERTGTAFNYLEYPSDIVLLVVLWRLRYKLSLRDLAEMFVERGFEFTHEAVREWEARFAPLIANHLLTRRRGQAGRSWYVDETYVNVKGKWCYLYRAIDRDGNLVDSASRFCRAFDEVRQFFRVRTTMKQHVSLAEQRAGFRQRLDALPGHGCDGLTQRRKGSEAVITILLTSVVSVLTHPYNSCRTILAPWTNAHSLPKATSRGRYFMPQSGARIRRSGSTYCKATRILPATISGVSTSISPRFKTPTMMVFCAN